MKMKIKIILLVACFSLSFVTACDSGSNNSNETDNGSTIDHATILNSLNGQSYKEGKPL